MLTEYSLQYREDRFNYPTFSIAYAILPVLVHLQLRYHGYLSWITSSCSTRRVLSHLDTRYNIIVVQVREIILGIICRISKYLGYLSTACRLVYKRRQVLRIM